MSLVALKLWSHVASGSGNQVGSRLSMERMLGASNLPGVGAGLGICAL